jgi:ribonuclease HII
MSLNIFQERDKIEVGIDEVGRGCLLGRVYAACVILPQEFKDSMYLNIKDSKKISKNKRSQLANYIKNIALDWSVDHVDEDTIDKINILQSSVKAMHKSLDKLNITPDKLLVDGTYFKPYLDNNDNYINYECIPNGDNTYLSIAAASIIAKVERDSYINYLVDDFPILKEYDIHNCKGYGTARHIETIRNKGITRFHRKTFGICKNY